MAGANCYTALVIEVHPFGMFVPPRATALLLGSFPGRQSCADSPAYDPSYDWFYRSKRGQFWRILTAVYDRPLETKRQQMVLVTELHLALGDVIRSCRRLNPTNADTDLIDVTYSTDEVATILAAQPINTIYFTSAFVSGVFRRHFTDVVAPYPDLRLVTLPSPSPRFARMTLQQKIMMYRTLLPSLPAS